MLKNDIEEQIRSFKRVKAICDMIKENDKYTINQLPLGQKRELLNQIVKRVYIGKGYICKIEWSYGGYSEVPLK